MANKIFSYAVFTRRLPANDERERFKLAAVETHARYSLLREPDEDSHQHPAPVRTGTAYCNLDDALADFQDTVSCLSLEGTHHLTERSHDKTVFRTQPSAEHPRPVQHAS